MDAVVRAPFQDAHIAVALQLRGHDVGLDAAGQQIAVAIGRIAPGVEPLGLIGRAHVGVAQGDAERAVHELVDVGDGVAVPAVGRARVQGADVVPLMPIVQGDGLTAVGQGPHGAQIDRARQALTQQGRIRGLVDDDAAQQFRRELVELDAAVVAGGDQFAAVQQGGGEVRAQAADGDLLAAAVQALHRHAGQTRQGFGDRDVRQLADVLGRNDFDDRGVVGLGRDRGLDRAADAGDDDFADFGRRLVSLSGGGRGLSLRRTDGGEGGGADSSARQQAHAPVKTLRHGHPPWGRRDSECRSRSLRKNMQILDKVASR